MYWEVFFDVALSKSIELCVYRYEDKQCCFYGKSQVRNSNMVGDYSTDLMSKWKLCTLAACGFLIH